ncbi:hypothetical protein E2I00_002673 [Balaenoptera physalus]|uniref:Glucose/Sorbosone dehydrogenase domain-containing protein n=1 Tax=Balaenoptera physalus TaxID=9770 RepID=A0A6A1QCF2_BALPH|nr:hypothetical protein E2I00_002673 [Balaenoptera physalus]
MLKMLSFKLLLLAVALGFFEGDAKFGERSEGSGARRRRCLNGNPPKRLKRRDRRMMSQLELLSGGEMLCGGFYPRLSCCLRSDSPGLGRLDSKVGTHPPRSCEIGTLAGKHKHNCFCIQEVVSGLRQPISALHSGDGSHRLFILEKEGYVKILTPEGEIFKEPYLDIHKLVQSGIKIFGGTALYKLTTHTDAMKNGLSVQLSKLQYAGSLQLSKEKPAFSYISGPVTIHMATVAFGNYHPKGVKFDFFLRGQGCLLPSYDEQTTTVVTTDVDASRGGDERGLLSLAFHPNYKKNGKLYVSYTTNQERWAMGPHDHILRVVEYTVSRKNPHQVDLRTARVFLEVAELHRKHLGGQLLFGPDGFLYIILGDGMITLDDMEEMDGLRSNPHFNSTNQPPEVFAHGLHDPGRCAVDRHPTDININLTILCSDSNGKNRSSARILQIIKGKDYESEPSLLEFKPFSNGPLVGGFVYRGCQSERLYGSYVFGDRNGNFLTLQQSPVTKQWQEKPLCLGNGGSCRGYFSGHILGFGEDELGEVYVLSSSKSMTQTHNGKLYKIVDPKSAFKLVMELQLALNKDEHFRPVRLLSALLRDPQFQSLRPRLEHPEL